MNIKDRIIIDRGRELVADLGRATRGNECAEFVENVLNDYEREVKKLNIFGVSQRSELLAFMQFISKTPQTELELYSNEELVDGYLKANCG